MGPHGKGRCLQSLFFLVLCGAFSSLRPQREAQRAMLVLRATVPKGDRNISPHHAEGKGSARCAMPRPYPAAGWSVGNFCRVTWLLGKEVLDSSRCPLGQLLYRLQGAGKAFGLGFGFCRSLSKKTKFKQQTKKSHSSLCIPSCTCVKFISIL